jgi:hypothetical protein
MKTVRNIFSFFVLLCFFGGILSSCEDECGGKPRIDYIINTSGNTDSLIVSSTSGNSIIIVGEHLASVQSITFGSSSNPNLPEIPAKLNASYITDNNIILTIPEGIDETRNVIKLVTAHGHELVYNFSVEVPPPAIQMFYSEFVEANDVLRIRGNYFFSPKVYFYGENDEEIEAVIVQSSSTEIKVTVPEKVAYSKPIKIVTNAGESISTILFRDKRNIIIDFDELWGRNTSLLVQGDSAWRKDGATDFSVFGEKFELPKKRCDGFYGAINQIGYVQDGGYIAYSTADQGAEIKNALGSFTSERIENLVLKFEIYVPIEYPISGVSANIYITPMNFGGVTDLGRSLTALKTADCVPGAYWNPFELRIDKTNPDEWVQGGSEEDFFTDGWMTVAVPLSDFKWNISQYGIYHLLSDLGLPDGLAYNSSLDPTKCFDFAFLWNPQDGKQGPGDFIAYFDNFRIVPDDGGGAVFDKIGRKIRYY